MHLRRDDGTMSWLSVRVSRPVDVEGAQGSTLVFLDEVKLPDAKEDADIDPIWMQHIQNMPMAVVGWDSKFNVTLWTGEADRMFGWTAEEVVGRPLRDLNMVHPTDEPIVANVMTKLSSGQCSHMISSNRNLTKDGRTINCTWYNSVHLDGEGRMDSVLSFVLDNTAMVNAEKALKESEHRLRTVMDNSLDGINLLDLRTLKYVVLSPAQVEMTGLTLEELQGMTVERAYELTHPDDRDITISQQRRVLEGKDDGTPVEYRWMVQGKYRWFSDRRKLVRDADGEPTFMVGLSRDITEEKEAAEALKRAKEEAEYEQARLKAVLDQMPIAVIISDKEGKLLMGNSAVEKIFRYPMLPSSSIKEYSEWKAYHPEDMAELKAEEHAMARALLTEQAVESSEVIIRRGDGTFGTVLSSAVPIHDSADNLIGGVAVAWDITDQKAVDNELRETKTRLETILDKLPVAIIVAEPPDGKVVFCNDEVWRYFRLPPKEMPDKSLFIQFPIYNLDGVEYRREEFPTIRAMTHGEEVFNEIIEFERADGSRGYANANAVPVKDENGNVTSVIGIRIDITNEIQAQKALAKSNAELQQFAYIASHDLQEPLRMVMSFTSLLVKKHKTELNEEAQQYLDNITTGAERMRELVNDLLLYSRIDSQLKPFSNVDLNNVVRNVLTVLNTSIVECGAKVNVTELPIINADELQMSQVIMNLMSNAIKFRGEEAPQIQIFSYSRSREWVIGLKDNGIGIDPRYADKLFQMFNRLHTRDEYPGTGMGLAISKKIIERHGGRIWFESQPGSGSTFYFSIPKSGEYFSN